jgi:hypothetical protein
VAVFFAADQNKASVIAAGGNGCIVEFKYKQGVVHSGEVWVLQTNQPVFFAVGGFAETADVTADGNHAAHHVPIFQYPDCLVNGVAFCNTSQVKLHSFDPETHRFVFRVKMYLVKADFAQSVLHLFVWRNLICLSGPLP